MANQEQVDRLLQGVKNWNTWRAEHPTDTLDLSNANLIGANLSDASLNGAYLSNASLNRSNLIGADLSNASLNGAYLIGADLSNANLNGANLNGTIFSNAILSNADLSNAILSSTIISPSLLIHSDFSRIYHSSADLGGANLSSANLSNADLGDVNLNGTDLSSANLNHANLIGANLNHANLSNAIFKKTRIGYTGFGAIDMRTVQELETVIHQFPSTIGTDTLLRSEGDIPEVFLRGAGLSDTFIEYARSLAQHPIAYYTCFISYSSQDEAFVKRLYDDLQNNNVRCWFAPHDMRIGDEIRSRIDESIRIHDKLLLVLSQHSIESTWVKKEVETAFEKEQQQNKLVLFPVKLDDTVMQTKQAWAADIRRMRHIGDFQRWKEYDIYQKSLERLLRALKTPNQSKD
ncbi:MAG TPA: pentapeptide repeat-containing protein [Ktedonobacteraceae bacterium]|nr:pentapeptide repeat-containing protein [Ktedonobacteraceae bacterium]